MSPMVTSFSALTLLVGPVTIKSTAKTIFKSFAFETGLSSSTVTPENGWAKEKTRVCVCVCACVCVSAMVMTSAVKEVVRSVTLKT